MTPFAQLAEMEKSAYNRGWYQAQTPPQWMNPYGPQMQQAPMMPAPAPAPQPAAPAQPAQPQARWGEFQNPWADIGISLIPGVGSVYMGNKAVQDFRQGKIGSGIGNLIWAGIGLIPGGGAVKGALQGIKALGRVGKGALGAAKAAPAISNFARAGYVGRKAMQGARAALPMRYALPAIGAGMAAPLLDRRGAPQMQMQPQQMMMPQYQPMAPQQSLVEQMSASLNQQ